MIDLNAKQRQLANIVHAYAIHFALTEMALLSYCKAVMTI
jgi:hypothetical protein